MRVLIGSTAAKKHRSGICIAAFCNKRSQGRMLCSTCRSTKQRQQNPLKYYYSTLRFNAKRRNKSFSLTLEEFKAFCDKTNYLKFKKGRNADSITIDRIVASKGYEAGNIQVLTNSANVRKKYIDAKLNIGSTIPAPAIDISGFENKRIDYNMDEEPPF
jgi:hypothetical protein